MSCPLMSLLQQLVQATVGDGTLFWPCEVDQFVPLRIPKLLEIIESLNRLSWKICYWKFALLAALRDVIKLRMFFKVVLRWNA